MSAQYGTEYSSLLQNLVDENGVRANRIFQQDGTADIRDLQEHEA